jgi:hypothetical protein
LRNTTINPDTLPRVPLHPSLALPGRYRRKIANLRDALAADPETRTEAIAILRSLADKIILHPGEMRRERAIELRGQMASIVDFARDRGYRADVKCDRPET